MKNIVTIGGGTGSFTVLSGLKAYDDISVTVLVSMADNGGSTGVLRDELGVLPPGDVRQCLVALSEHSDVVRKLMNYRFEEGGLSGHSFGNILLAALEKVTGDFAEGVEVASEILKVKGKVIPITKDNARLCVTLSSGDVIIGEDAINHADLQKEKVTHVFYEKRVTLNAHAYNALQKADIIIIAPGNYYCSLLPILLVDGCVQAIQKSNARIMFPVNLTNKQGHTLGWNVSDYVSGIEEVLQKSIDTIIINDEEPSEEQIKRYMIQEGNNVLVKNDIQDGRIVHAPVLSHTLVAYQFADTIMGTRSFIRHDGDALARTILSII